MRLASLLVAAAGLDILPHRSFAEPVATPIPTLPALPYTIAKKIPEPGDPGGVAVAEFIETMAKAHGVRP
jgi:hypothetical protein